MGQIFARAVPPKSRLLQVHAYLIHGPMIVWHGTDILHMGPSIYDVHTEGDQAQVDACGQGEGVKPHVDVHTEN